MRKSHLRTAAHLIAVSISPMEFLPSIYVPNRELDFRAYRFLLPWITPSPAFFASPLMIPSASLMLPLATFGVATPCVEVGLVFPLTSMFLGFINHLSGEVGCRTFIFRPASQVPSETRDCKSRVLDPLIQ
jgi:hypothetical protein